MIIIVLQVLHSAQDVAPSDRQIVYIRGWPPTAPRVHTIFFYRSEIRDACAAPEGQWDARGVSGWRRRPGRACLARRFVWPGSQGRRLIVVQIIKKLAPSVVALSKTYLFRDPRACVSLLPLCCIFIIRIADMCTRTVIIYNTQCVSWRFFSTNFFK